MNDVQGLHILFIPENRERTTSDVSNLITNHQLEVSKSSTSENRKHAGYLSVMTLPVVFVTDIQCDKQRDKIHFYVSTIENCEKNAT